jgi:hypothetical protein
MYSRVSVMTFRRYMHKYNAVACRPDARQRPVHCNIIAVFSVPSFPRCYKQDNSRVSRELLYLRSGTVRNQQEGECPSLEAVTRRLVKTQEAEKTLLSSKVSELVKRL